MNYVITGSIGHISKPVVEKLTTAGHTVTVITSTAARVADIEALGAKAAVGSVDDAAFLTQAFTGADAVYLMIPPTFAAPDWFTHQKLVANNYVAALKANSIKNVVLLSSIGAHLRKGVGPVDGVGYLEEELLKLEGINAKFMRPSFFYYNLFAQINLIKNAGIMGSNGGSADDKIVLVDTNDIADVVADALLKLDFTGISIQYIASDVRTYGEVATVLGNAIGKPGTPWVLFTDEQSEQGMLQAGLPKTNVDGYVAMGKSQRSGLMQADFFANPPAQLGKVKLEDFAKGFAAAYNAQ
ncbi:MAG: NAD(P)H-binding protein [Sphingobacteriales bacterium JAD_PAG50586_3]|nr:MAG: NAD(P)H-binding protein [Sphingobacteriales bacterium JAD_PAG50586_3]